MRPESAQTKLREAQKKAYNLLDRLPGRAIGGGLDQLVLYATRFGIYNSVTFFGEEGSPSVPSVHGTQPTRNYFSGITISDDAVSPITGESPSLIPLYTRVMDLGYKVVDASINLVHLGGASNVGPISDRRLRFYKVLKLSATRATFSGNSPEN